MTIAGVAWQLAGRFGANAVAESSYVTHRHQAERKLTGKGLGF